MKIQESLEFLAENPVDGHRGSIKVELCFDMLKHAILIIFGTSLFILIIIYCLPGRALAKYNQLRDSVGQQFRFDHYFRRNICFPFFISFPETTSIFFDIDAVFWDGPTFAPQIWEYGNFLGRKLIFTL